MTKALTAGVLNGIGDVVAQRLISPDEPFDVQRLQVFVLVGAALVGPGLHLWYGTLARLAAAVGAAGSGGTFFRVACDQLLFAPMFLSLIVGSVMTLEGHPGLAVQDKLRRDLFAILRSNWAVWVPFQLFNFRFVPLQLQVLSSNIVALAFNVYLSYVSHK